MTHPTILIADDSRTVRSHVRRILVDAGYGVLLAGDGRAAVAAALEHRPDLVILDIQMPVMDGYEVCQRLLAHGSPWSDTPIVFLTQVEGPHLAALGNELGAYIRKPVLPDVLIPTVCRLLDWQPVGEPTSDPVLV